MILGYRVDCWIRKWIDCGQFETWSEACDYYHAELDRYFEKQIQFPHRIIAITDNDEIMVAFSSLGMEIVDSSSAWRLAAIANNNLITLAYPDWPKDAQYKPLQNVWNKRIKATVMIVGNIEKRLICDEEVYFYKWNAVLDGVEVEEYDQADNLSEHEPIEELKKGLLATVKKSFSKFQDGFWPFS